jgi:phosphoribosylanthranilate isomerase
LTLIKICGITTWDDAKAAVDAGADMLGFVCDEHSERRVDVDVFCEIASRLPRRIVKVGVFDQSPHPSWSHRSDAIRRFDRVQYYEDRVWTDVIGENWDMSRKIKAFHLRREADLRKIAHFNGLVQSYLVNVNVASSTDGGNADANGWDLVKEVHQFGKRVYLAGGLRPDNVRAAMSKVIPYAVDVNVGVEARPGVKDVAKLQAFVAAVRGGANRYT